MAAWTASELGKARRELAMVYRDLATLRVAVAEGWLWEERDPDRRPDHAFAHHYQLDGNSRRGPFNLATARNAGTTVPWVCARCFEQVEAVPGLPVWTPDIGATAGQRCWVVAAEFNRAVNREIDRLRGRYAAVDLRPSGEVQP